MKKRIEKGTYVIYTGKDPKYRTLYGYVFYEPNGNLCTVTDITGYEHSGIPMNDLEPYTPISDKYGIYLIAATDMRNVDYKKMSKEELVKYITEWDRAEGDARDYGFFTTREEIICFLQEHSRIQGNDYIRYTWRYMEPLHQVAED